VEREFLRKYVNEDGEILNGTEPADYTANQSVAHYLAEAADLVAEGFFSTHLTLYLHPSLHTRAPQRRADDFMHATGKGTATAQVVALYRTVDPLGTKWRAN